MREDGFTITELIVTVAIIGLLTTIGTLAFNSMSRKGAIEAQAKEIYSDLMKARAEAMFQKVNRSATVTATQFSIYPNDSGTGTPILEKTYKQTMVSNDANLLVFDANGLANVPKAYCIGDVSNPGVIDSIIVSQTMILMGKRTGGACKSANITAK